MRLVPATREMYEAFTGQPPTRSARIVAAVEGDHVFGLAGVYPDKGRQVAFAELGDEIRSRPRDLLRLSKLFVERCIAPLSCAHAVCDENVEAAARFLEHLGFQHVAKGVWQWRG